MRTFGPWFLALLFCVDSYGATKVPLHGKWESECLARPDDSWLILKAEFDANGSYEIWGRTFQDEKCARRLNETYQDNNYTIGRVLPSGVTELDFVDFFDEDLVYYLVFKIEKDRLYLSETASREKSTRPLDVDRTIPLLRKK